MWLSRVREAAMLRGSGEIRWTRRSHSSPLGRGPGDSGWNMLGPPHHMKGELYHPEGPCLRNKWVPGFGLKINVVARESHIP
ncbi:unnamed protein product [Lota lota]